MSTPIAGLLPHKPITSGISNTMLITQRNPESARVAADDSGSLKSYSIPPVLKSAGRETNPDGSVTVTGIAQRETSATPDWNTLLARLKEQTTPPVVGGHGYSSVLSDLDGWERLLSSRNDRRSFVEETPWGQSSVLSDLDGWEDIVASRSGNSPDALTSLPTSQSSTYYGLPEKPVVPRGLPGGLPPWDPFHVDLFRVHTDLILAESTNMTLGNTEITYDSTSVTDEDGRFQFTFSDGGDSGNPTIIEMGGVRDPVLAQEGSSADRILDEIGYVRDPHPTFPGDATRTPSSTCPLIPGLARIVRIPFDRHREPSTPQ